MPYFSGKYYPLRRIVFFFGEGLLIFTAIYIINRIFLASEGQEVVAAVTVWRSAMVTVIFQLSLYFFDLYDLNVYSSFSETATRMTQAFGFGCIALAGLYYLFPVFVIPTSVFGVGYLLVCSFLAGWRFFYIFAVGKRVFSERIIILGTGEFAGSIAQEVTGKLDSGYEIAAFVGSQKPGFDVGKVPFYETSENNLGDLCRKYEAERLIVALEDRRGTMPVGQLVQCKLDGIEITAGTGFYEDMTGKLMVEKVNPDWIIFSTGFTIGRINNVLKRVGDIALALVGLVFASPIMLISACIVKLESPGPVFYKQERVGLRNRRFDVFKFRSMKQDAEKDGAVWAMKNDTRVTRFGGFIRKVRIDELPQLWNVLMGEMSFVGPRPERPVFVKQLNDKIPFYSLRHNIKPGVTGWAQICYPYGASEEDALRKLEYDLYYLKNLSFSLDLWILFQTIKTVLFQKGAR
nr:TIGR03013 family PEP-CTERM/XrtA system glycosyltransferase [Desulfobulbaceae bacterium]